MSRADGLAVSVELAEIDLLLVSGPYNLRYLTGYTGSNGLAVASPEVRRFLTDFRYGEQVREQVTEFDVTIGERDLLGDIERLLPPGPVTLGFEAEHVSVARLSRLREVLPDRVELVPTTGMVEGLRRVKEDGEVATIRAAAEIADAALSSTLADGIVGRTEREVAWILEREMRERGAEAISFPPIVAAGVHAALPHAMPRDVEIPPGVLVVIDWGAQLDGYCSDCTRTYATGKLDDDAAEAYAVVERAQAEALDGVAPGHDGREIDAIARDAITAAGLGERFGHGLGHGVGLEVHEAPTLSQRSHDTLASGNIVTVEPGVYVPDEFGIRIEDLVVVTETGGTALTSLPKGITTVG